MPTVDDERAAEIFGVAISEAVRRAVRDVGPARLAGRPGADADGDVIDLTDGAGGTDGDGSGSADPYALLGVSPQASWDEIVAARNRRLRAWHPDAGGDDERLRRLNLAFAELRIRRGR